MTGIERRRDTISAPRPLINTAANIRGRLRDIAGFDEVIWDYVIDVDLIGLEAH